MSFFLQFVALGPKQSKDVNNNMRCFLVLAAAGWKQRELCCSHGETQEWNHYQEVGKEGYQSVRQQPGKLLRWHECRNNSCVLNLLLLWSVDIPSHTVLIRVTNSVWDTWHSLCGARAGEWREAIFLYEPITYARVGACAWATALLSGCDHSGEFPCAQLQLH